MNPSARAGVLLGLLLLCRAVLASADPLPELPGSQRVGGGVLTWFGITVYEASLYAEHGRYAPARPHALKIDYRLGFTARQLAERSLDEIERIHGEQADREDLVAVLQAVFRDVQAGDHLLGVHYPGRGADFYSAGRLLGRLERPRLAAMFFDIWLDSATSEPGLRRQLLGTGS
jgi:hypothetical protein